MDKNKPTIKATKLYSYGAGITISAAIPTLVFQDALHFKIDYVPVPIGKIGTASHFLEIENMPGDIVHFKDQNTTFPAGADVCTEKNDYMMCDPKLLFIYSANANCASSIFQKNLKYCKTTVVTSNDDCIIKKVSNGILISTVDKIYNTGGVRRSNLPVHQINSKDSILDQGIHYLKNIESQGSIRCKKTIFHYYPHNGNRVIEVQINITSVNAMHTTFDHFLHLTELLTQKNLSRMLNSFNPDASFQLHNLEQYVTSAHNKIPGVSIKTTGEIKLYILLGITITLIFLFIVLALYLCIKKHFKPQQRAVQQN